MRKDTDIPSCLADLDRSPMAPTLQCRHCAMIAYPGDRYCACCGGRLAEPCRRCGRHRLHPVANYCTYCGAALVEPEKTGPVAIPAADEAAGTCCQDPAGDRLVA